MSSVALNPAMIGAMETDASPLRLAIYLADQSHVDHQHDIQSSVPTLISQLARRADLIVTQVTSRSSLAATDGGEIETRRLPFGTDSRIGQLVAGGLHPWLVGPDVDLWYYPNGFIPRIAKPIAPSVGTLHNTDMHSLAKLDSQIRSSRAFRVWTARTRQSLKRHRAIMAPSQHAARNLADFCEDNGIVPPTIAVTYEACPWESFRGRVFSKSDYVVHLASTECRGCTRALLQLWSQLQKNDNQLPELKIIGELNPEDQQIVDLGKGIRVVAESNDHPLVELLGHSRALLLPCHTGDSGLPALAAYYVRTPVCYARGTAMTEFVHDPQHRGAFDLGDAQSLRGALDAVISLSSDQVRSIGDAMYKQFSAERVCERVIRAMRDSICKSEP